MSIARRTWHCVTLYRPEKTYNGFTLFTPNGGTPSNTWLIDMRVDLFTDGNYQD